MVTAVTGHGTTGGKSTNCSTAYNYDDRSTNIAINSNMASGPTYLLANGATLQKAHDSKSVTVDLQANIAANDKHTPPPDSCLIIIL